MKEKIPELLVRILVEGLKVLKSRSQAKRAAEMRNLVLIVGAAILGGGYMAIKAKGKNKTQLDICENAET